MAQPLAFASTSSSASSHGSCSYQIFINHRGSDVKKTFASHLYRRLRLNGFRVFLDQQELERGQDIYSQIKGAIATASVHVAILSSGYAQSSWCLDELVLMLESMESRAATVIPVFYHVKPSDLRWTDVKPSDLRWTDKKGGYAEDFHNHEKKGRYSQQKLEGWRKSLFDVSHISGFELEACNGDEGVLVDEVVRQVQKIVDEVVRQVQKKVGKAPLPVATHPTRLDEKLQRAMVLWEQLPFQPVDPIAPLPVATHPRLERQQQHKKVEKQQRTKVGKAPLPVATHPTGLDEKHCHHCLHMQQVERTVLWEQQHNRGEPNIVANSFFNTPVFYQQSCFINDVPVFYQQSCFSHDVRNTSAANPVFYQQSCFSLDVRNTSAANPVFYQQSCFSHDVRNTSAANPVFYQPSCFSHDVRNTSAANTSRVRIVELDEAANPERPVLERSFSF